MPLPHKLVKSSSATNIRDMAAVALQQPQPPMGAARDEHVMDTRTPSPVQRSESHESNGHLEADGEDYKPNLSQEVAMLSTKLVNAINYQTNLDDSLQATRHELDMVKQENARIRAEKQSLDDAIKNGFLVRKSYVDETLGKMRAELAKEKAAREEAEKVRKETENELENLTSALFEEANTMVAAARKDTEAVEKRNSQLKSQIKDTEMLLSSQQEQLQDLKLTMEKMSERGDNDTAGRDSVPSTPVGGQPAAMLDALQLSPNAATADITPEHPLYFSQVLMPVLRNDVAAYTDFHDLMQTSRRVHGHSRGTSSGNSIASSGLTSSSQPNLATSSPSLPGAFSFSTNSSPQSANFAPLSSAPPLKDSKFYKRCLAEDIEPTLRLDLAPGLSFLSRRSVLASLLQGSLVVEPFMPQAKFYGPVFACALCGEQRKNEPYVRKHRFRTSEEESAQRYPLCDYCLGRIRAAGDFVGFLRMVNQGHWRAESEVELKGAWEEAIRLRERMFWARIGGGVVPNMVHRSSPSVAARSARASLDSIPEKKRDEKRESVTAAELKGGVVEGMKEGRILMDGETEGSAENERQPEVPSTEKKVDEPTEKLRNIVQTHRKSLSMGRAVVGAPTPTDAPAVPAPAGSSEKPAQPATTTEAPPQTVEQPAEDITGEKPEATVKTAPISSDSAEPTPLSEEPQAPPAEPVAAPQVATPAQEEAEAISGASPMPTPGVQEREIPILHQPEPAPAVQQPAPEESKQTLSPSPNSRRTSAVLERVRALESEERKLPGSFE